MPWLWEAGPTPMIHAPLKVLLLDPSYEATGFALLDGNCNVLDHGTLYCTNPDAPQRRRANEIAYRVGQYASTIRDLTHIGMEEPYAKGRVFVGVSLNRLNGAIGQKLWELLSHIDIQDMRVDEWREKIGFSLKALALKRSDPQRNDKIKKALLTLAQERWPGAGFTTADPAEAALMGMRYLMAIHGTEPFEKRGQKPRAATGSSSTSGPSKSSATSKDSSGAQPSPTRRRSGSKKTG